MKISFYFTLKAVSNFYLNILVMYIKTTLLGKFQTLRRHALIIKQLQYTYYPISQEVKAIRQ